MTYIEEYFWNGQWGMLKYVTPKYAAPPYGMKWSPPKGTTIPAEWVFDNNHKVDIDKLTEHGTVTYDAYGWRIIYDKDAKTLRVEITKWPQGYWGLYGFARELNYLRTNCPAARLGHQVSFHARIGEYWRKYQYIAIDLDTPSPQHIIDQEHNAIVVLCREHPAVTLDLGIPENNSDEVEFAQSYRALIRDKDVADQRRYYHAVKHTKTDFTVGQLESLGGLAISWGTFDHLPMVLHRPPREGVYHAQGTPGKYTLNLMDADRFRYVIKEEAYDGHGSRIFKMVAIDYRVVDNVQNERRTNGGFSGMVFVALIGKEYTGQWWMHYLPPTHVNRSIAACERWILHTDGHDRLMAEA